MNWPGPDTGHARLPGPDTAYARLPGPDRARVAFPPPPMPVVFISADVVAEMRASATTGWIPWENADVVAEMNAAVDITTSTATVAEIVADMNAAGIFVVDVIDLPVDADMTANVVVVPAAVIEAHVELDASAGITGRPVAVIFAQVNTSMDATASVAVQGFTTAKVISEMAASAAIVPSPSIAVLVTADMTAAGVITAFTPSGMTKNGIWAPGTTYPWVTISGWTADAGSTVVSDGVTVRGTKSDAVVTSQVRVRNTASGGNECAMRILVGGVVVKTGSVVTMGGSQTVNLSLSTDPISVSTGQIVTVQIQGQYGFLQVQAGTDTWVRIDRQPLGMTKAGGWVPTANGSWLTVPAWTAEPGATVSGNGVQPRDAKANAVVSGQLSIAAAGGAYQVSVRLKVDGVVVKTITDYPLAGYTTTNVPIASDPMAVTAGQVATIECWFVNYANSFTIQSGVNTYVRIT